MHTYREKLGWEGSTYTKGQKEVFLLAIAKDT